MFRLNSDLTHPVYFIGLTITHAAATAAAGNLGYQIVELIPS